MSELRDLVAAASLPASLAALISVLVEHGVPLVVSATDQSRASAVRHAFTADVLARQPARDAVAGGVVIGASLQDVLRVLGAEHDHGSGVADEARDLGVVLVLDVDRVAVAHYVRPVERDGAGHLQRRPPAVLGAWNAGAADFDEFWWAFPDELATRAGLSRAELEDAVVAQRRRIEGDESVPGPVDARH